jgi:hypothetical protein
MGRARLKPACRPQRRVQTVETTKRTMPQRRTQTRKSLGAGATELREARGPPILYAAARTESGPVEMVRNKTPDIRPWLRPAWREGVASLV